MGLYISKGWHQRAGNDAAGQFHELASVPLFAWLTGRWLPGKKLLGQFLLLGPPPALELEQGGIIAGGPPEIKRSVSLPVGGLDSLPEDEVVRPVAGKPALPPAHLGEHSIAVLEQQQPGRNSTESFLGQQDLQVLRVEVPPEALKETERERRQGESLAGLHVDLEESSQIGSALCRPATQARTLGPVDARSNRAAVKAAFNLIERSIERERVVLEVSATLQTASILDRDGIPP